MKMSGLCGHILVLICLALGNAAQNVAVAGMIYSAADDFSPSNNANGVWSYGKTTSPTNPFAFELYTRSGPNLADAAPANLLDTWHSNPGGYRIPAVLHNGTSNVVSFTNLGSPTITFLPGELAAHPGSNGELSVVRFTAPFNATYNITSAFRPVDPFATTNIGIFANGTALFNGLVYPGSPTSFSTSLALNAGDVLDFAVGAGSTFLTDTTGIAVQISAVPEPSSLLLIAVGLPFVIRAKQRLERIRSTIASFFSIKGTTL